MLDFLLREALPDPLGDGGLPEVVRIGLVAVDAGFLGDLFEEPVELLVGQRAVVIFVPAAVGLGEPVKQRRVRVSATGVDIEPVRHVWLAVGQRPLPAGPLPPDRLLVERDRTGPAFQVDVLHPERTDCADSEAGVEQHLKQSLVSRVVGGLAQSIDLVLRERLVGVDLAVGDRTDLDVFGPLAVVVAEELPQGLSVVPERPLRHLVLVLVVEKQAVDIGAAHFYERCIGALSTEAEGGATVEIRAGGEPELGVLVADEFLDRLSVALVDICLGELVKLALELFVEIVDVGYACHTYHFLNTKDVRWLRLRQLVK